MSLLGYRLPFEYGEPFLLQKDIAVTVAPLTVIAFLKMSAYLDRLAERQHDLADIAHVIEGYARDDPRRFDPEVTSRAGDYEWTTAVLLGLDMGRILNVKERPVVDEFLARVRDERDASGTQARMAALGPAAWRRDPEVLLRAIDAFECGLTQEP